MLTCKSKSIVLLAGAALYGVSALIGSAAVCHADSDNIANAPSTANPTLRIHLARFYDGSASLIVADSSGFSATLAPGGYRASAAAQVDSDRAVTIVESPSSDAAPSELISNDLCELAVGQTVLLTPLSAGNGETDPALFALQRDTEKAHRYRGALEITALPGGSLRVIDVLSVEDYLKGVIGPEMGMSAPLEALKAQAIAARTYAIKNRGKCSNVDADLDDTTNCQNYLGFDAENWRCRTAVDQTAGEVLTYDSNLIDAVYATDCGGESGDGGEPYLKPVADEACGASPPWTLSLTLSDLQSELAGAGLHGLTSIADVTIGGKDDSGRVTSLTLTDMATHQPVIVAGSLLRKALGYDRLRSTLFEVSFDKAGSRCIFTGRGWGHGLGMCQNGAIDMAKSGSAKYKGILLHYYSGVAITELTPSILAASASTASKALHRTTLASARTPIMRIPVRAAFATQVDDAQPDAGASWMSGSSARHGL